MHIEVQAGVYVVAVSGGVDSMVLLNMLSKLHATRHDIKLIVAHFDHGIRPDSHKDKELVAAAAEHYGLAFVCEAAALGADTSEAAARNARYDFLRRVAAHHHADAIITAHHQDDLIETAVINILRGTGRKGLTSLASTGGIIRPLLAYSKAEITDYAAAHHITWHEDSTNSSDAYLRNYIRRHIIPALGPSGRRALLTYVTKAQELNPQIDTLLDAAFSTTMQGPVLQRSWFIMLPYAVSCEAMAAWLRSQGIREFDRRTIERLVVIAKVASAGKQADINAAYLLKVTKSELHISHR